MLTIYEARSGALEPHKNPRQITEQTIWIDELTVGRTRAWADKAAN